jgi:hypothetical protein
LKLSSKKLVEFHISFTLLTSNSKIAKTPHRYTTKTNLTAYQMNPTIKPPTLLRAMIAGLTGGLAWFFSIILFFGPAQAILASPEYQSQKFLFVMGQLEPLPYTAGAWWLLPVGLLVIGVLYGIVYHFIRRAFAEIPWWKKGLQFGLVAWALMVPWFEFYLPWNVMHEPALLVALEMVLWLAVLLCVGIAIVGVYEWRNIEKVV